MGDNYLWAWTERRGQVTVLKVRGELDTVTASRFAAQAASELRQMPGPVAVDLSFLDFIDCAGARALAAVVASVQPWRLTEVCGIQPAVSRVLGLLGMDLSVHPGLGELVLSLRGQELLAQAHMVRSHSREVLLESSAMMGRLATTYAGLAAARERRAEQERARAEQMQRLSETARALAERYRQRATGTPVGRTVELLG